MYINFSFVKLLEALSYSNETVPELILEEGKTTTFISLVRMDPSLFLLKEPISKTVPQF
jgi:hypothetical protein